MDELILAALQDRIEPDDVARLESWRRASPHNEAHYQAMARIWGLSSRSDPLEMPDRATPSLDELRSRRSIGVLRRPAVSRSWARGARLTAIVAAAAAILLFIIRPPSGADSMDAPFSASEFVTERAEMVTASLDDGSVVRLAPESRLRVTPVAQRREVWLDGEAFFAVARNSARPFAVRTRVGSVEVLGTRFDLRVVGDELRLVVTEGEVTLVSGEHRLHVVAGQIASVRDGGLPVVENAVAVDSLLAWAGDFLVFQSTPLRQVAAELESRYGVRVLLPDSSVASRTVTAWFTNQSFPQVFHAICRAVDAHCSLSDNVASIEP